MRIFFVLSGLLALLISCSGKDEEKADQTVSSKAVSGEITYTVDTTTMIGYMAYPAKIDDRKPGVIVVHEWWGQTAYARKRADMLADLGYVALAVDMYGDGKTVNNPGDAQKLAISVMGNFETAKKRFRKALDVLKADAHVDTSKIGAIGYCFGGSVVLSMVNAGIDLEAVAAFHAGLQLPVMPGEGKIDTRVLVCNGAADPMIPEKDAEAYKSALDAAGIAYKYVSYPGAMHAFSNPDATELGKKFNLPIAYDEKADTASWNEMQKFFKASL